MIIRNSEPGPTIHLNVPALTFPSEEALVEHLLEREQSDECRFLFRGQALEYRRRWPLVDGPFRDLVEKDLVHRRCWRFEPESMPLPIPLVRETLNLPSLIPTNTRAYERYLQSSETEWQDDAFDDMMVYFWTAVCTFFIGLACRLLNDRDGLKWLESQWHSDYPALYKLRSVGQHYGMDTGLLDATSSIQVALWFATHEFHSGLYRPWSHAILYVIDRQGLREVEDWVRSIPEHEGEFDAATVDIRETPATFAPRASRQQGWSLVGWDHPRLVINMVARGFLFRCDFCTRNGPSAANSLTRDYLVPTVDPMALLFRHFWTKQPRSLRDAQDWIDRYWNVAAKTRVVLDEDGTWFEQLSSSISVIYDYYVLNQQKVFGGGPPGGPLGGDR